MIGVVTAAFFGLNNMSIISSQLVTTRLIRGGHLTLASITGFFVGGLLSAATYRTTLGLSSLMNYGESLEGMIALLSTLLLLLILTLFRLPASITYMLIGGWIGVLLAAGGINIALLSWLLSVWAISPVIALVISHTIYPHVVGAALKLSITRLIGMTRILSIILVFYTSMALGASGLGVICALSNIDLRLAPLLGVLSGLVIGLAGSKIAARSGYELVILGPLASVSSLALASSIVFLLALAGVPASLTHSAVGSNIGAGFAHETYLFNRRRLYLMIASWSLSGILSILIAYSIGFFTISAHLC